MDWSNYKSWQAVDPTTRPDVDLVDGYLAGAAISLQDKSSAQWVLELVGPQGTESDATRSLVAKVIQDRFKEVCETLSSATSAYTPIFADDGEGEFDLSGWATGFMEAIGPDADLWSYLLEGKREGGMLGLIAAHAVGATGTIAKIYLDTHPDGGRLKNVAADAWSFIPGLLDTLHVIKLQQIPDRAAD